MQTLLVYIAGTVCVENFDARAAMVHLPAVTLTVTVTLPLQTCILLISWKHLC